MKKEITFTAKQVGERVKERRTELNLTMPELGKRVGVNKSTIQRYEAEIIFYLIAKEEIV